ncbi:MAG TPA: pyruvate, phosphate dikinase [Candidatus Kapabacteria bacterium]|nr:pyruvate, phosphate dikinase [Candidatus Kapabacteria bacterium]
MANKYVYFFSKDFTEGKKEMKDLLGGKGANLAEMSGLKLPIPPGFTITTEVCDLYYKNNKNYPQGLEQEVEANLERLEKLMGKKLGDKNDPLLVSVRSGAAASMPGMMDTILNLGLNDQSIEGLIEKSGNTRFAYDSYRRFIQMFGNVVLEIEHEKFEEILHAQKHIKGIKNDVDMDVDDLKAIVVKYKALVKEATGSDFPQSPKDQLWKAIDAVFGSWNNARAIKYRELYKITNLKGTAVNIQSMVFGNLGETSGTGVAFSRNPSTGENKYYGEYLMNAQGEDVVAGIRTPLPVAELEKQVPEIYKQLIDIKNTLEHHYADMQDMEFTIENGKLFILQTRNGKRTGFASVKVAVDMMHEGLITKQEAIMRVKPEELDQLLHPNIDPKEKYTALAKGLPASPGAAVGKIVFNAETAEEWASRGEKVVLVRKETSPEDIGGMAVAQGILTATGGMTSHAAVVARGMGKCCVAGCGELVIKSENTCEIAGHAFKEGDMITLNGTTGEVIGSALKLTAPGISGNFEEFMNWVDEERPIKVRTNADTPKDSEVARKFGAEGIGLCRTEHMFFEGTRIDAVREMILAEDKEGREKALAKILPMQKEDFIGIFEAMNGFPVTIRYLDPPLHEFIPHTDKELQELAKVANIPFGKLKAKADSLHEFNPMLGHRGCRLAVTFPEIAVMQTEAVIQAALAVKKKGVKVLPEIMIPLTGTEKEFEYLRKIILETTEAIFKRENDQVDFMIGTMIEIPRACIVADKIAETAQFFSFGTNDLTQMTFGYSRDDAGTFLPEYVKKGILPVDPFQVLDREGVGQLIDMGIQRGRKTRHDLKVGICGEHGGEPSSVEFCYHVGMNYVSCSPYRVPIARLAAAQAKIKKEKK